MKFTFGNRANYKALDGKFYTAIVLGPHTIPQEGDYLIAYELSGSVVLTHCWESSLGRVDNSTMTLLERERQRAVGIAQVATDVHEELSKSLKAQGNRMYFVESELANECRTLANSIAGGSAASYTLGETMRDRIEKEYAATVE